MTEWKENTKMWFVIGVAVGYFINRAFAWTDRILANNLVKEYDEDRPRGTPISFDEWKKRNGI